MFKMSCSQCGEMYLIGEGCKCWGSTNLYEKHQTWTINTPPKPVGYWVLYAEAPQTVSFAMHHKPTDEQIKNTQQLLGWTWKEEL